MKLKKALKTLESKGTGFVFSMSEMEQNYNPEKFVEEIQTYGYALFYCGEDKIEALPFRLAGCGYPYQYIELVRYDETQKDNTDGWGYYTFTELYKKFNSTLPLSFGLRDVVHKQYENNISLYH